MNRDDQLTNIKISYENPGRKQANKPVVEALNDDDDESPRSPGGAMPTSNRNQLQHTYEP